MKTIQNYIDGTWVASKTIEIVDVVNPATGEVLVRTPLSTTADVDAAARAAAAALPAWRQTPAQDRIQYLFKLKALLESNLDEIGRTITMECGKTLEEAKGEMRRAIENVEVACGIPDDDERRNCRRYRPRCGRDPAAPTGGCVRHDCPL